MSDDVTGETRKQWDENLPSSARSLSPAEQMQLRMKQKATEVRLLKRSCESLLGICGGLMADGCLNDDEIRFLDLWLRDNEALCKTWPGEVVWRRVEDVLKNGTIEPDERDHLHRTLGELLGGTLHETGATSGMATTLPIDGDAVVTIPGKTFCLTGEFLFGTRKRCEHAIIIRTGLAQERVTLGLDFLVVGTMASREWAHTSHGRKIEKAVEYKKRGSPVLIVDEQRWAAALEICPAA